MAKYVILTLILAGLAIGITLYFMKGIEQETKKPEEETATTSQAKPVVNKPQEIEKTVNVPKEEPPAKPEVKEAPKKSPPPKAVDTKALEKVKELKDKLDLLSKAGLTKSELAKVELDDPQKAFANAEKILIPDLINKISIDSAQNDVLMDAGKFKESKLKEGEKIAELPKAGEDKTLDDGTTISRKDETTISVKTADGKESQYPADSFLFATDKDGKEVYRIVEGRPQINFNERLKAYLDTIKFIVGKDKAIQILDNAMATQWDQERKSRLFEAMKLLY